MNWVQLASTLLMQYSVQRRHLKEAPEKIKGLSIQAAIYGVGLCFMMILTLASIMMTFADLGKQWDSGEPTHFTGTLAASLAMLGTGVLVFGLCVLIARFLARKPSPSLKSVDTDRSLLIDPLVLFAEEFLTQLVSKLK